jgi:hypothetical protein
MDNANINSGEDLKELHPFSRREKRALTAENQRKMEQEAQEQKHG